MAFAAPRMSDIAGRLGWLIAALLTMAWTAFVLWRVARLSRAAALKGDRAYDQRTKFALSSEYRRPRVLQPRPGGAG